MLTKHMKPLSKGGQTVNHKGKGSAMASMPNRSAISQMANAPGAAMNNYAKATPMPQPSPASAPGIGSGDFTGGSSGGGYGG